MSMQLLLNQHVNNTPPPPPLLEQTTNDRGVYEQTTVPGCAQTTLAALAKRQFGGLKRHLSHTLELGPWCQGENVSAFMFCEQFLVYIVHIDWCYESIMNMLAH